MFALSLVMEIGRLDRNGPSPSTKQFSKQQLSRMFQWLSGESSLGDISNLCSELMPVPSDCCKSISRGSCSLLTARYGCTQWRPPGRPPSSGGILSTGCRLEGRDWNPTARRHSPRSEPGADILPIEGEREYAQFHVVAVVSIGCGKVSMAAMLE